MVRVIPRYFNSGDDAANFLELLELEYFPSSFSGWFGNTTQKLTPGWKGVKGRQREWEDDSKKLSGPGSLDCVGSGMVPVATAYAEQVC